MTRQSTDRVRTSALTGALALTLLPAAGAVAAAQFVADVELRKVLYVGAGTLVFAGFFGGMVKVLIDEVIAGKRRREDAVQFVANVLSDLKGVYDRVGRARVLIPAHRSVKTYGEEMRALIEARVQLRNVTRALERSAADVDDDARAKVTEYVGSMGRYLEGLVSEFRDHYKPHSDRQRGYEERAKVLLKNFAEDLTTSEVPGLPGFVWDSLSRLERLSDFISEGEGYRECFERPLDDASEILRSEHARLLRAASGGLLRAVERRPDDGMNHRVSLTRRGRHP